MTDNATPTLLDATFARRVAATVTDAAAMLRTLEATLVTQQRVSGPLVSELQKLDLVIQTLDDAAKALVAVSHADTDAAKSAREIAQALSLDKSRAALFPNAFPLTGADQAASIELFQPACLDTPGTPPTRAARSTPTEHKAYKDEPNAR